MTTDLHAEAIAYLDLARDALTDPISDPRAGALAARQLIRTAEQALAQFMAT
ncbi:hypothetical protein [Microtetraspora glauca]|uniref:Uncharacterized protein n=1 Tax=Microtetraspora glauca TaxID=1996 RepID=A0ABV3GAW0_MICGL